MPIRPGTAWLANIAANSEVRLRIRGGRFSGAAHQPTDAAERQEAMVAYCESVHAFDYVGSLQHRSGRPTGSKIRELQRSWFAQGVPLVVDLRQ